MLSIQLGIAESLPRGESADRGGDCFVQTLANAYKLRYSEALAIAKRCGFTPKGGTQASEIFKIWKFLGVPFIAHGYKGRCSRLASRTLFPTLNERSHWPRPPQKSMSVSSWLKIPENQIGRYMIIVKGHIFAVVHGNILDDFAFSAPDKLLAQRIQVVAQVTTDSINNLHFLLKGID